jgi:hypothetical protein
MSTYNEELKGEDSKKLKWPGLIIATQDTELPKGIIEKIKTNCKTSYEESHKELWRGSRKTRRRRRNIRPM